MGRRTPPWRAPLVGPKSSSEGWDSSWGATVIAVSKSELTVSAMSPAPYRSVTEHGARMKAAKLSRGEGTRSNTGRDLCCCVNDGSGLLHHHGHRIFLRLPTVTRLTILTVSPTGNRVIGQQGA